MGDWIRPPTIGILFLAVLCAEVVLVPVLGRRHIYVRYNATSGDSVDNIVERLGLENKVGLKPLEFCS